MADGGYTNEDYSSDSDSAPLIDPGNSSPDDDLEEGLLGSGEPGLVRILIPDDELRTDPHERFPKERGKSMMAASMLFIAGVLNVIVLSIVHERVPYKDPPLPDLLFSLTPYFPYGLTITEYIMLSNFAAVALLILFHRHRWIALRRFSIVGALCYGFRCVTMLVTQVPVADPNWKCMDTLGENATLARVVIRALRVVTGLGLNIAGGETLCGDYIYSGHTIVLVVSALFIGQYSPRRWRFLHLLSWIATLSGMFLLIMSRGHYTIDVIISYVVCTRIFYIYHTMAAMPSLRISPQNHHRKEIWWRVFEFMEGKMVRPLPRRYDNPFPVLALALLRPRPAAAAADGEDAPRATTPLLLQHGDVQGGEYAAMAASAPLTPTTAAAATADYRPSLT